MNERTLLTLLSGTAIQLDATRSIILPEAHDDLVAGDTVELENEKREFICVATVVSVQVETFALLQQEHFRDNAHPELGSWANAYTALQQLVPGFSQNDKVTVVVLKPVIASHPGLTIGVDLAQEGAERTVYFEPSEDEAFASLDEIATEANS